VLDGLARRGGICGIGLIGVVSDLESESQRQVWVARRAWEGGAVGLSGGLGWWVYVACELRGLHRTKSPVRQQRMRARWLNPRSLFALTGLLSRTVREGSESPTARMPLSDSRVIEAPSR